MKRRVLEDIEDVIISNKKASPLLPLWKIQLEKIKEWRKDKIAPIDVYGCDRLADSTAEPKVQ